MSLGQEQRRLSAILAADVAGYTRLVEQDTEGTVAAWRTARTEVIQPVVSECAGRVVKLTGDGFLAEFSTVQDAVRCAIGMQERLADNPLDFRMGISLGDVVDDGEDIHGEGVNIAARIEGLAEPGGISVSAAVYEQVRNRIDRIFHDMGEHFVKHVSAPVRVYRIGEVSSELKPSGSDVLPRAQRPSIAVLPFANMSGESEQEYFSDGVTEDLITSLSRVRWFLVTARNSTFAYKGQAVDVKGVGRELGVRYVLEGSVRKAGERVRVTAQLIDVDSGNHIWAERYDRKLEDIFELQDEITRTVVGAIEPELSRAEQNRARRKPPGNLDAWDNYQRGISAFYRATLASFNDAEKYFARAIELDPEFSAAHAMYARTFCRRDSGFLLGHSERAYEKAIYAARQAVSLDPGDSNTHVAMGFALERSDIAAALGAFEEALSLNPDSALAHYGMGRMLIQAHQAARGIESMKTAIELSPTDGMRAIWYWQIAEGEFAQANFEQVLEWSSRAMRAQVELPGRLTPIRIAALALLGYQPKADSEREAYLADHPNATVSLLCGRSLALGDDYRDGLEKAGFPG